MEIGVHVFSTDLGIGPARLAREAEDRGFAALFLPEHTHIPALGRIEYPDYQGGGELPGEYLRTYDPFVALASAAAVTSRLRIGTGVCLAAQHDPIILAKQVATLDQLSCGRFIFGIGYGWNLQEMRHHGVEPSTRRSVVREKVLAMKELWTMKEATFDGDFVRFGPTWSWPKPMQDPHPPILLGGVAGPVLFRHIVEYADGWMPIGGSGLVDGVEALRHAAEDAGRDPDELQVAVSFARPDARTLDHYRSLGVRICILGLPHASPEAVLAVLDTYVPLLSDQAA
jgi:probable F420-dependent oxidoreductase